MSRTRRAAALAGLALLCAAAAAAERESTAEEQPRGGGSIGWFSSDELDLIGTMGIDVPAPRGIFGRLEATTTIEKTRSDFTFLLSDLDYRLEVGWRERPDDGLRWSAFVGQIGSERVDRDGQGYARYLAAGLESAGHRDRRHGLQWSLHAGAVVQDREVAADAVMHGTFRFDPERGPFGLELTVDLIGDASDTHVELRGGPSVRLGDHAARLFLHGIVSDHPFGVGSDGALLGFEVASGPSVGSDGFETYARVGTGGGEGRLAGRFLVGVRTPNLLGDWRGAFEVDANILTADDTGDLFYFYHLGLERERKRRWGAYFYHRSNHTLAEPNPVITSINVAEFGVESMDWRQRHGGSFLVWMARAGWLIDSSFGEDRRYHLRAGARLRVPGLVLGAGPFLHAELEQGDVERRAYSVGMAIRHGEARLEYRRDTQYFATDRRAWLLLFSTGY